MEEPAVEKSAPEPDDSPPTPAPKQPSGVCRRGWTLLLIVFLLALGGLFLFKREEKGIGAKASAKQRSAGITCLESVNCIEIRNNPTDDRRHALRRLRTTTGIDYVQTVEPVPRCDGGRAAVLGESARTKGDLSPSGNGWSRALDCYRSLRAVHRASGSKPSRAVSSSHTLIQPQTGRCSQRCSPGDQPGRRKHRDAVDDSR